MRWMGGLLLASSPVALFLACSSDPYGLEGGGGPSPSPDPDGGPSDGGASVEASSDAGEVAAPKPPLFAFVGSSDGKIRTYAVDRMSGAWTFKKEVSAGTSPSFLAFKPASRHVIAVDEAMNGAVRSFTFDPSDGSLKVAALVILGQSGPTHLSIHPNGEWIFVANYGAGTTSVLKLDASGTIDAKTTVSSGEKSHWAGTNPSGSFVFVSPLGLNAVKQYKLDMANSALTNETAMAVPGGPRHLAFHPSEKWLYVINELAVTVTSLQFDKVAGIGVTGATTSALPPGQGMGGVTGAEIVVHPNGKYVYASTRGYNSIAHFAVGETTGSLIRISNAPTGGNQPRSFAIDPEGTLLFAGNQAVNEVVGFRIAGDTGALVPLGKIVGVPGPTFVGLVAFP